MIVCPDYLTNLWEGSKWGGMFLVKGGARELCCSAGQWEKDSTVFQPDLPQPNVWLSSLNTAFLYGELHLCPRISFSVGTDKASQILQERPSWTCFSGGELDHNTGSEEFSHCFISLKAPMLQIPLGFFILGTIELFFPWHTGRNKNQRAICM